jgi:hypothetical protein|tara:strand:- start:173 stop:553 length:381 start_codon:yes stop_codon:yes gene_type:complete
MKYLLTTLLLVVSSIGYSQDTLRIPTEEMEEFFLALDTLRFQDSIQTALISDLETEIILFNKLTQQDSLLLFYKDQEIDLLKESISLYNERLKQVDKWYNKPAVSFAGGFLSTILLIKVIDYTLPE